MTIKEVRKLLLQELLFTAVDEHVQDRVEKLNELHRRINAIDRYVSECPFKGTVAVSVALDQPLSK